MDSLSVKLSRKQLYEEVWQTPIQRLCAKYGLSDVGLAKVCRRMNIPRPPRGYWRRRTTGFKVSKAQLPKPGKDTQLEVTFDARRGKVPAKPTVKREIRNPVRPPLVETVLADPHPLVTTSRERLEAAAENRCGILVPKSKRVLGIQVSRTQLDRCLRLMDSLIKSWETEEGLNIRIIRNDDGESPGTFLCSGDDRLQIIIEEGVEEFDPGPTDEEKLHPKWEWKPRTSCRPTAMVTLRLEGEHVGTYTRFHRRYRDLDSLPVEDKAMQIWRAGVEYFEKLAIHHAEMEKRRAAAEEAQRRRELEWKRWEAERKREEEREMRRQEELKKIKELVEAAKQWDRARQVRNFIPVCESQMKQSGIDDHTIAAWTKWARAAADQIDPLIGGYPDTRNFDESE